MERYFKICFLFFSLLGNISLFAQGSVNMVFYKIPYNKTDFKVIGILQSDSLLMIKEIKEVKNIYFHPKKTLCTSYYLTQKTNFLIKDKKNLCIKSKNGFIRLMYNPIVKFSLIEQDEDFPNFGLKDSLLIKLINNNPIYGDIPKNANLCDSIQGEKYVCQCSNLLTVHEIIHINTFLILEMNVFEFNQMFHILCACENGDSTEYPFRIWHKYHLIRIAIPIDKKSIDKYANNLKKYYINEQDINKIFGIL